MTPLVSAVIPSYNRVAFISDAIESALGQTHQNLEIIVVDDGSTDETDRVMERYASNLKVRYFKHPTNRGIPGARNTGIRHARGDYIAFLDSDDIWLPEKVELQLQVFSQDVTQEIGVVWSDIYVIDRSGSTRACRVNVPRELDVRQLFRRNFIIAGTAMIRRSCLDRVGLLDEELRGGSDDYDFWLRLAPHFKFRYVPARLARVRLHGGNYSSVERQIRENFVITDKAVAANPELATLRSAKLARLHYVLGLHYFEAGNNRKARNELWQAIRWNPLAVRPLVAWALASCGPVGRLAAATWWKFRN
jgi:glycosyltransferase involved in cell wall biosynthesis